MPRLKRPPGMSGQENATQLNLAQMLGLIGTPQIQLVCGVDMGMPGRGRHVGRLAEPCGSTQKPF